VGRAGVPGVWARRDRRGSVRQCEVVESGAEIPDNRAAPTRQEENSVGRKHAPKGQIVLKKTAKLNAVAAALPAGATAEAFSVKFKEMYPEDWDNIIRRYKQHQRQTAPGKKHPMPEPEKYLLNMVRVFLVDFIRPDPASHD